MIGLRKRTTTAFSDKPLRHVSRLHFNSVSMLSIQIQEVVSLFCVESATGDKDAPSICPKKLKIMCQSTVRVTATGPLHVARDLNFFEIPIYIPQNVAKTKSRL